MAEQSDRVEALFHQAADLPPQQQRALLDAACRGDPGLRAAVERLLADDARLGGGGAAAAFLDSPVVRPPSSTMPCLAPAGPPLPPWVGRYRVLRLLGEGGMGTVYEAEQDHPRRAVALKVIRPGLVSPALLKRFAQEAEILGRLHHPGIAQIYEAGLAEDGQPFFALEFVRGVPLDEYAHLRSLTLPARLELLARVCDAVQHAHERGVIHRDLKPSNVLVDEAGQPKVLDFGVARATDADLLTGADRTRTGQLLGTPSYMSPEQVAADPAALDSRSDVYTLGVILFELLAGRPPYPLGQLPLPEVARVIREQEPSRLGSLDTRLRGDVETVVAKALEKDPARRYPSAAELAADIRRHLRSEPIRARPPSALYHLMKFTRRHKALVVTTAAFLGLLLLGGAVTAWQAVRLARAERDQAVQQARRSQDVHDALARAALLREQARSGAGDRGEWAEARELARQAEVLVQSGPVAPGLAGRVAGLLGELDEELADRRLVARVEEARLLQAEVNVKEDRFTLERALPRFRDAFADYGLRPVSAAPAEAAALLRRRPAAVRGAAVAALDQWLLLARQEKAAEVDWLERVLSAADPDDWRQRLRVAMRRQDRPALEKLAREVNVAAQPPQALFLLDRALQEGGSTEGAVRLLRRAQEAYPGDFWINHNLGMALALSRPAQLEEAIRFLTAAVALRPESPGTHLNLGIALRRKGRLDEAGATFRKVIVLKADYAMGHLNLGHVLRGQGDRRGATACFRRVTELIPKSAPAHDTLGTALLEQGDLPGAIASYRRALALDPNYAQAYISVGNVLWRRGDLPAAAAWYLRCLQIDAKSAEAHCNLGRILLAQGDFRAALAALRRGHALGSQREDWPYPSDQWVKQGERLLELDGRLPAILKGEGRPQGAAECLQLAEVCHYKRLYATAVRFFTEAFAADARLTDPRAGHRTRAASSAALAGCGQGEEAAGLDEARRAELRRQAQSWLRADLAGWARLLPGFTPQGRAGLQEALRGWQTDPNLAGVRDAAPLAALPPAERAAWQQLWSDVVATQALARDAK